jgi:glycosyltransferase involved in cell wall biosynthesis
MRIGVLTTSFPRHAHDIAGHFVLASCQALIARGHHVEALVPDAPDLSPGVAVHHLQVTPITYLLPRTQQRTFYGAGVPDNLRSDPRAWLGLAPFSALLCAQVATRARGWDAIISHWALPCGLAAALRPARCRHLSVLHSADVHLLSRLPARRAVAQAIVKHADHLWLTSRALRDKLATCLDATSRHALAAKSSCGPMGVDPPLTVDPRSVLRERLGTSNRVALVLSRLVPIKGVEHAIAAVAGTDTQLIIAGDGPERARLQALAAPLGAQVRFVGMVTGTQKAEWLSLADVLLLPSIVLDSGRTEGVPTALLEAMSYGCPVIASDVGGVREIITDGHNGWLVPPQDPTRLRQALRQRAFDDRDQWQQISQNARQSVEHQRWSRLAERWELLL